MDTTTTFEVSPIDMKKRRKIDISPGNTVRVYLKIQEKGKTRLQAFEGLVISRKHGTEAGATFTVRKVASGVGMEKTFPLYSPVIDKIEVIKKSKVRRSKLYYIRDKAAKEIRRRMKQIAFSNVPEEEEEEIEEKKVEDTESESKEEKTDAEATENKKEDEEKSEEAAEDKEESKEEKKEEEKPEETTEEERK